MKNNETGEFELVMGNRQLLTGFLIVVLLFGVAFAMGYIVGRNSTPSAKLAAEAAATTTGKDARPQPVTSDPTAAPPDQAQPAPADKAPAQPPADAPAPAPSQPATQPASPPAAAPVTQAAATQAAPPRETSPAPAADLVAAPDAPPGSYWQVIATSNRTSAEALLQSLKDKGFPVTLGPGPNNMVRVLVGPFTDTASKGRAKSRLEEAGFHPVLK